MGVPEPRAFRSRLSGLGLGLFSVFIGGGSGLYKSKYIVVVSCFFQEGGDYIGAYQLSRFYQGFNVYNCA